ncbi:MAG: hypothetical protein GY822_07380 [Deltaproteobacteria bacterium]|nr:hypothetical protein [Deltaproteobacteria bacterium]
MMGIVCNAEDRFSQAPSGTFQVGGLKSSPASRIALAFIAIFSLFGAACNSGGIAHRVPENAVDRVTGADKLRLDAARQKIQAAKEKNAGITQEKQQAIQAIQAASEAVDDAKRALIEHEKKAAELQKKKMQADRYQRFREGQVELFDLKKKMRQAEEVLAFSEYELVKFELVGRVESGSEKTFKTRLGDFRAQLQDAKMAVAAARQEWTVKSKRNQEAGREFRR